MKFTVADLTSTKNDIRKYLISETDIYVDGDKLYNVVIDTDDYNYKAEYDDLKRKLDDVVSMVNAYITAERAYSGESAYNLLENELNRILEDE